MTEHLLEILAEARVAMDAANETGLENEERLRRQLYATQMIARALKEAQAALDALAPRRINCPYYGGSMFLQSAPGTMTHSLPFLLLGTGGNQCAFQLGVHAPCWMEMHDRPIDWAECVLLKDIRVQMSTDPEIPKGDET